ncbi:MAG: hypothetical protein U0Q16_28960 [Bryobacteraceae bacterium]
MAILLAMLAGTVLAAIALTSVEGKILYVSLLTAIQFGDNFLLNSLDHLAAERAGASRRMNDAMGNGARLLGMLSAPVVYTSLYGSLEKLRIVIAGFGALAFAGTLTILAGFHGGGGRNADRTEAAEPASAADKLLFGFAVSVYASLYLFAANMIYLARDVLRLPNAEARGGGVIVGAFLSALVVNGLLGLVKRKDKSLLFGRLAPAPILLVAAAAALLAGVQCGFRELMMGGAVVGAGYGAFLLEIRNYASRKASEGKTSKLLTWFNNLGNISALAAFALMAALAAARSQYPEGIHAWTLSLIATLPALGLILLWKAAAARPEAAQSLN